MIIGIEIYTIVCQAFHCYYYYSSSSSSSSSSASFLSLSLDVCMRMCEQVHIDIRGQFPLLLFTLFLRQFQTLNLKLAISTKLIGQQVLLILPSPHPQCQGYRSKQPCPAFSVTTRDQNSGSRAYTVSNLPTKPSLHSSPSFQCSHVKMWYHCLFHQ